MSRKLLLTPSILALYVSRFADGLGSGLLLIAIPLYIVELPHPNFPFSDSILIAIAASVSGIVGSTLGPVMGKFSDDSGLRKPFMEAGFILVGFASLAYVWTERIAGVLVLRAVHGLGLALIIPAARALVIGMSTDESRGQSMGGFRAMRMLGLASGPIISGLLQVNFGFDVIFYAGAAITLLGILPLEIWVKETPRPSIPASTSTTVEHPSNQDLVTASIFALMVAFLLVGSTYSMVISLKSEFDARIQMSVVGFGAAFSVFTLSRLLFEVPMGRSSDSLGRKNVVLIGLVMLAPATFLLGLTQTTLQLMILRIIQGIAAAAIAGPALVLAAEVAEDGGEAQRMGVVGMGFGLGAAFGALLGGVLVALSFETPFFVFAFLSLLAFGIVYRYVPQRRAISPTI